MGACSMPSIRSRVDNGLLFFEFRFEGARCREQTLLTDSPANRKKLEKVLDKIESEITAGTFIYANYFPNSKALQRLARKSGVTDVAETPIAQAVQALAIGAQAADLGPLFSEFSSQSVDQHSIE